MRRLELERMNGRLQSLSPEQYAAVESLTKGLLNKLLHNPMTAIKAAAREGDVARLNYLAEVFQLETKTEEPTVTLTTQASDIDLVEDASQTVSVGRPSSVRKV